MRRVVLVGVGVLVTLAGVIFSLQGIGVLGGSVMSGVTFWAVAGPVIALAGLALAAIGLRGGLASQARRLCWRCDRHGDTAIFSPPGPPGAAGRRFVALDGDFAQVSSRPGGLPPPNSPRQGVTVSSPVPYLSPAQLLAALSIRDLSDPGEGPHAIQVLIDQAVEALSRAWSCEVRWCRVSDSPGNGVPVGASGRAAVRRVSGRASAAWHAGGSFVMSARSPGVRLRTLPTGT